MERHNPPKINPYLIFNCPAKIKIKEDGKQDTTIKKLLIEELSFGSIPIPIKTGFVIVPPPFPHEQETIPSKTPVNDILIGYFS